MTSPVDERTGPNGGSADDTRPARMPQLGPVSSRGLGSTTRPRVTTSGRVAHVSEPLTRRVIHAFDSSRRVWSPIARLLGWISPLGWSVLALGLLCLVVARRLHWTELAIIAASCLVLAAVCLLLTLGRTRVEVRVDVEPVRVRVGEPATGRVVVRNTSRSPKLPLLVELPVGLSAGRFVLPTLAPGRSHEELFVVPTQRRGVIPIGPASTVQGDPLGLMRRAQTWTDVTELFVHPATVPIETLGAGLLRDLEGSVTEDQSMSDLAFHALREYQPGDDRRHIHWRSSAKANTLLVRQFLDTRRTHVSVLVDADPAAYRSGGVRRTAPVDVERDLHAANRPPEEDADVEVAISVGASIAVRVLGDDQECTLVCGQQVASELPAPFVLDALARVVPGEGELLPLAAEAVRIAPDSSTAFLVTGPIRSFMDVRLALAQYPPEVRQIAVVIDPSASASIREVSGLTVLTLAGLDDLRRLLSSGVM